MTELRYKVLTADLMSPFQDYQYELGKWYEESRIGEPGESGCVRGLYAGPIESLIYRGVWQEGERVYECEVDGRQAGESPLKECWERMRVIRQVEEAEVRELARAAHERLGWLLEEALYPVHPLRVQRTVAGVTEHEKELLRRWSSVVSRVVDRVWSNVVDSVGYSVVDSVRYSVRSSVVNSVRNSVWDIVGSIVRANVVSSVGSSVGDSVMAYIGSLFPCVRKWRNIDHPPGKYPFQSGAELWRAGLVPSFDDTTWRLHAGEDAAVVYEMEKP